MNDFEEVTKEPGEPVPWFSCLLTRPWGLWAGGALYVGVVSMIAIAAGYDFWLGKLTEYLVYAPITVFADYPEDSGIRPKVWDEYLVSVGSLGSTPQDIGMLLVAAFALPVLVLLVAFRAEMVRGLRGCAANLRGFLRATWWERFGTMAMAAMIALSSAVVFAAASAQLSSETVQLTTTKTYESRILSSEGVILRCESTDNEEYDVDAGALRCVSGGVVINSLESRPVETTAQTRVSPIRWIVVGCFSLVLLACASLVGTVLARRLRQAADYRDRREAFLHWVVAVHVMVGLLVLISNLG
jgi:hypothetical protein